MGEAVFSRMSIGFDGLLNYYKGRNEVCNLEYEQAFMRHTGWSDLLPKPYFAVADEGLFDLFRDSTREGITIAARVSTPRKDAGCASNRPTLT